MSRINVGSHGVQLTSLAEMYRFAEYVIDSGLAPKGMNKPSSVLIAVQMGLEVGMAPMQALQSIGVINGRPGIFGDAALALCRASGLMEGYRQSERGTGDELEAVVQVKRSGDEVLEVRFSVKDAKTAKLWGKEGPWTQYPKRMLMWRARGFALRDAFGDVLRGMRTFEELQDMPMESTPITEGTQERASRVMESKIIDLEKGNPTRQTQSTGEQGGGTPEPSAETETHAEEPTVSETGSTEPPSPEQAAVDGLLAYKERLGDGRFFGILSRNGFQELDDVPVEGDKYMGLVADLEDALKAKRAEPVAAVESDKPVFGQKASTAKKERLKL